jgi:hypothetical protein
VAVVNDERDTMGMILTFQEVYAVETKDVPGTTFDLSKK